MGLSCHLFVLDHNDDLHRLPSRTFDKMLRGPTGHRFPRFAGSRARMTNVVVELVNRQPIRVVWTTYSTITFDGEGRFDADAFDRHQRARAELALALLVANVGAATVVDAATRFVAQGGRWAPSGSLACRIEEAALGLVKCPRL